jgi:hypothetical protein
MSSPTDTVLATRVAQQASTAACTVIPRLGLINRGSHGSTGMVGAVCSSRTLWLQADEDRQGCSGDALFFDPGGGWPDALLHLVSARHAQQTLNNAAPFRHGIGGRSCFGADYQQTALSTARLDIAPPRPGAPAWARLRCRSRPDGCAATNARLSLAR